MADDEEPTALEKIVPAAVKQFDAFPKLPSTYQSRSDSRGFLTIIIFATCFLFIINDIGDYFWGWPEFNFDVDREVNSWMQINLDMVVDMPCQQLNVDLRDVTGDRLHLSDAFVRDGAEFDFAHARELEQHQWDTVEHQRTVVPQSRKHRGFFGGVSTKKGKITPKPKYKHNPAQSACRIYGNTHVKKVTANLHITAVGHGYQTDEFVASSAMNLTHMVNELSFGPYFPDIVQPLDGTVATTYRHAEQYQYFITVVPTIYEPKRTWPIYTNQYSVTQYHREVNEGSATPGIFFKFDIEPIAIRIRERTTSFTEFIIRVVGVFGGVWCCLGWALRVSYKAVEVVTGVKEGEQEIVAVEATGAKKRGWGGGELKRRVVKQGNGWVIEGANSEWAGVGTPHTASFNFSGPGGAPGQGYYSPTPHTPLPHTPLPHTPLPGSAHYGYSSPRPPIAHGLPPPTPHGHMGGFPASPFPGNESPFAAGQAAGIGSMGGMNHLGVPGTPPAPGPPPQGPPRRKDSMASLNGDQTKKDR